jgi:hypothetical protein
VVFEHSAPHKLRCSLTVTKPAIPYCRYTQTLTPIIKTAMSKKIEEKYEKLIGYFKYLITITGSAITIIVAVALYFTYNNLSDLRKEVKESTTEYKETIKEFNSYAQKAIDQTQTQSNNQIALISTEAKQLALTAAKEKIDQTFERENIDKLIEEAAERKLGKEIDVIVNKKLSEAIKITDEQLNIIPDLILSADKVRWGDRKALDYLDSIQRVTDNPKIKQLIKIIIGGKIVDYNNSITQIMSDLKYKSPIDLLSDNDKKLIINRDTTIMINNLIRFINNSNNLNDIAVAFLTLRNLGVDIQTFEFEDLKKIKTK